MAFKSHFAIGIIARLAVLLAAFALLAWTLITPGFVAMRLLAGLAALGSALALWAYIRRTNLEIARFMEAIRFGDMQARFSRPGVGSGFDRLGETLDAGIAALRDEKARLADAARFNEALIDDVPVALLTVDPGGAVTLTNKAARKLFNRQPGVRPSDFACYGQAFVGAITGLEAGKTLTLVLDLDIGPQRAIVRAAALARMGGLVRVIAVQVIQHSLNAMEVAAQSGLVRVLTHEIMNSLTPVTSLARSAADLVARADTGDNPDIADARMAVETLSRRADGVMHFVETYREITRPPKVERQLFQAAPFVDQLKQLVGAEDRWKHITLATSIMPETHLIDADPDLLAQVIINLLRNAADAALESPEPRVSLGIDALRGGRTRIDIGDSGPGVPEAIRKDIFLPFMTTKVKGTGVGLSFARQVILGHDGSLELLETDARETLFRIVV